MLIGAGNVASRLLGLVREQVIAALFGATGATSAFRTATRVSTAVYDLLLSGATTAALVPVFSDYVSAGRTADLSRVVSTFVNLTFIGLGAIVVVLVVGAPLLVTALGADAEHFELAVELTRIALPSVMLLGVAGILTAVLYARQTFAIPAFAGAVYNAGIIIAAVVLVGSLGIHGLALGLALGAFFQLLVQLPAFRGLHYQPVVDLHHPGVRLVIQLYTPVFVGMIASYVLVIVDTYLAWQTGPDSVAAMAFATTLVQFPIGLVGAAASLAILPSLSRMASDPSPDAQADFEATLARGLKMVLLLIVPLAVTLVLLRQPTVSVLFERLAFDAVATQRTSLAVLAYAPQMPFVVLDQLLIVAFYARKQTLTPVLVGIAGVGVYLAVALVLVVPLGMPGLALANAVQNSAHAAVLFALLSWQYASLRGAFAGFVLRVVVGGVAAAAGTAIASAVLAPWLDSSSLLPRLAAIVGAATVGLVAYWATLVGLRVREVSEAARILTRHLPIR
ncbi:MAG: putative lipid flippase MurJ [Chloroflexi bacterium]|nr:putative lipid flippase MurJ [Chloroflexota bacterium]